MQAQPVRIEPKAFSTRPQQPAGSLASAPQASPTFGAASLASAGTGLLGVYDAVYGNEARRYLAESVAGLTLPRAWNQYNRDRSVTGQGNPVAAVERLVTDFAADLLDTVAPGVIAVYGVGKLIDRHNNTFVQHNMGHQALGYYREVAEKSASADHFLTTMAQRLQEAAQAEPTASANSLKGSSAARLDLRALLNTHLDDKQAAEQVASVLGKSDFDIKLRRANGQLAQEYGQHYATSLKGVVSDLRNILKNEALKTAESGQWGQKAVELLEKTERYSQWQMLGNGVALAASLSIPFAVRLMTKHFFYHGEDKFPGTKGIEDHYEAKDRAEGQLTFQAEAEKFQSAGQKKHFVPFPYLQQAWKNGNYLPAGLTAGFFGVIGGTVAKRFHDAGLNALQPKNWFRVYEFERNMPMATIAQMELTYGLLCAFRMLSSRNKAEFREASISNAALGWPTLTYGFPALKKAIAERFGNLSGLMIKAGTGEVRSAEEISETLIGNALKAKASGPVSSEAIQAATKAVKSMHVRTDLASAATNMGLLAFAEPQLDIWLTNRLEVQAIEQQRRERQAKAQPVSPTLMAQAATDAVPASSTALGGFTGRPPIMASAFAGLTPMPLSATTPSPFTAPMPQTVAVSGSPTVSVGVSASPFVSPAGGLMPTNTLIAPSSVGLSRAAAAPIAALPTPFPA
jgi:hypothetical protein